MMSIRGILVYNIIILLTSTSLCPIATDDDDIIISTYNNNKEFCNISFLSMYNYDNTYDESFSQWHDAYFQTLSEDDDNNIMLKDEKKSRFDTLLSGNVTNNTSLVNVTEEIVEDIPEGKDIVEDDDESEDENVDEEVNENKKSKEEVQVQSMENEPEVKENKKDEEKKPYQKKELGEEEESDRIIVDYANKAAGALILEKSQNFKDTSNLLNHDDDKYAISPCSQENKFVVIGLSEDILVKTIVLTNYERYSSHVNTFQILGSQTYPIQDPQEWADLGSFTAISTLKHGKQTFTLEEPAWARYLKFRFLTHFGNEHYCTITQIRVHGSTMLQGFHEQYRSAVAQPNIASEQQHQKQVKNAAHENTTKSKASDSVNLSPASTSELTVEAIENSQDVLETDKSQKALADDASHQDQTQNIVKKALEENENEVKSSTNVAQGETQTRPNVIETVETSSESQQGESKASLIGEKNEDQNDSKSQAETDTVNETSDIMESDKVLPNTISEKPHEKQTNPNEHQTTSNLTSLIQLLKPKVQSASCLESLNLPNFRTNFLKNNEKSLHSSIKTHEKIEPIFKTLVDEIKLLKQSQEIQDLYIQHVMNCYNSILVELAVVQLQELQTYQSRIEKLERSYLAKLEGILFHFITLLQEFGAILLSLDSILPKLNESEDDFWIYAGIVVILFGFLSLLRNKMVTQVTEESSNANNEINRVVQFSRRDSVSISTVGEEDNDTISTFQHSHPLKKSYSTNRVIIKSKSSRNGCRDINGVHSSRDLRTENGKHEIIPKIVEQSE